MMSARFSLRPWLAICLLVLSMVASGDDGQSAPRMVTSTVEPWGIFDGPDRARGILVDFQRALFERAGLPLRNTMQPYPRVIKSIASGEADLAVMFVSPQSAAIAHSLGKVVDERIVIVTRAEYPQVKTLDDFNDHQVGHIRGSRYGAAFDQHAGIVRVPVTNVEQGLRMLLSGRIDAMTSTEHSLLYAMYINGIDSQKIRVAIPLFSAQGDLYVARDKINEPWVAPLKSALKSMTEDGSLLPALYNHAYWPYNSFCFAGGQCLGPTKQTP